MSKKLEKIIQKSNLNKEQQIELLGYLKYLSVQQLNNLADFLNSNINWVEKLYNNLKDKQIAFRSNNKVKIEAVLAKERKMLEELIK